MNDWARLGEGYTVTRLLDGRVLMVGDITVPDGANAPVTELFTPGTGSATTGTWETTPSTILQARDYHTATLLADGRVLVTGGSSHTDFPPMIQETVLDSAELYDPGTGQWSVTASLYAARRYHTATLLLDGRVLVLGGSQQQTDGYPYPSYAEMVELYDPRAGRWSPTQPMPEGRAVDTATLLPDGRVLVTAGSTNAVRGSRNAAIREAFLFDPRTESWSPTSAPAGPGGQAILLSDGRVLVAGEGAEVGAWGGRDAEQMTRPRAAGPPPAA